MRQHQSPEDTAARFLQILRAAGATLPPRIDCEALLTSMISSAVRDTRNFRVETGIRSLLTRTSPLELSHEAIAEKLGTTRETVTRAFKRIGVEHVGPRRWNRPGLWRLPAALALLLLLPFAGHAQTRTEVLRWTQQNPATVTTYTAYYGTTPGQHPNAVPMGNPAADANGVRQFVVPNLPNTGKLYFVATASNPTESSRSNERCREGGQPCTTAPPPPTQQPAVLSFTLWDAQTDTVVDADFRDGDEIPDAIRACAAIEILANSATVRVRRGLDALPPGDEFSPPWSWEGDDGPGRFRCAPSLAGAGSHTLTATPFDSAGVAGPSVARTFTVAGGAPPPLVQPEPPRVVRRAADCSPEPVPGAACFVANGPIELTTKPVAGATAYRWVDGHTGTVLLETTAPAVLLQAGPANSPLWVSVQALAPGRQSPVSLPSDPIYAAPPQGFGWDVNSDGSVNALDHGTFFRGFKPAFEAGCRSCAPVAGVSPCACP